jgi:hypothetical protein
LNIYYRGGGMQLAERLIGNVPPKQVSTCPGSPLRHPRSDLQNPKVFSLVYSCAPQSRKSHTSRVWEPFRRQGPMNVWMLCQDLSLHCSMTAKRSISEITSARPRPCWEGHGRDKATAPGGVDLFDDLGLVNNGNDPHRSFTPRTAQGIGLIDLLDQLGPALLEGRRD